MMYKKKEKLDKINYSRTHFSLAAISTEYVMLLGHSPSVFISEWTSIAFCNWLPWPVSKFSNCTSYLTLIFTNSAY